jgi:chemotaxis protein CheX
MTCILELPRRLDCQATGILHETLLARRGEPVTVDAGAVTFLGAIALQLMVSAQAQWRSDGIAFRITPQSRGFTDGVAALGLPPEFFSEEPFL